MNPVSPSFVVPVTFPNVSEFSSFGRAELSEPQNLVQASCSTAQPSTFVSWGLSGVRSQDINGHAKRLSRGAVIGCQDGTLYIFHPTQSSRVEPHHATHLEPNHPSRPASPFRLSRGSHPISPPASPSGSSFALNQAPYNVTSRSRVVSGITREPVEAPKNYVDFDDEADKLKDLLKGRSPREKTTPTDAGPEKSLSPSTLSVIDTGLSALKRNDDPKSLLSATNSPSFTPPQLVSTPASPWLRASASSGLQDLDLQCHVIPPQSGVGKSIAGMQLLDDNRLLAVLRETGDLSIFTIKDGTCIATTDVEIPPLQPPAGVRDMDVSHDVWIWSCLEKFDMGESTILLVSAAIDPNSPSPPTLDVQESNPSEKSRLVMFEFRASDEYGLFEAKLDKIGQWYFGGPAHGVGVHREPDNTLTFSHVTPQGHLVAQRFQILPRISVQPLESQAHEPSTTNLPSLPLPNPFKGIISRSVEHIPLNDGKRDFSRIALDEEHDSGLLLPDGSSLLGLRPHCVGGKLYGVAWSERELIAFEYEDKLLRILFVSQVTGIRDVKWVDDDSYAVTFQDRSEFYALKAVDADNDDIGSETVANGSVNTQPILLHTLTVGPHQAVDIVSTTESLITTVGKEGRRQLKYFVFDLEATKEPRVKSRTLWRATRQDGHEKTQVTSMLPLELNLILLGYSDGYLRQCSLATMTGEPFKTTSRGKTSDTPLGGYVTGLHVVQNSRTKERFIVGGADDGSVAFWALDSLKLCARWILFTTSLTNIVQFSDENVGPLRGCVLCISHDGTIAVIVVDGFQFLYLIPGSASRLQRVCLGEVNLLLIYADRRARLWDAKTKEFWRSMGLDKAEEMLSQGGWTDLPLDARGCLPDTVFSTLSGTSRGLDSVSTLFLDLERFITEATTLTKSISTGRNQTRAILSTLDRLRSILSALITPGLNDDIDEICQRKLGIHLSFVSVGFLSNGSTSIYNGCRPQDPWCISEEVSAARVLSITVALKALSLFEEFSEGANTVITFYATSLASTVGPYYRPPSLSYLARRWFDTSNELRHAARMLFDSAVTRLSDEEASILAGRWQHHLPCLQPTADRELMPAALSLFLCGYLAAEKYSLLSTSALTDISKSIALYLHDEQSVYRVLAVDLCSRGFHIWQHYIDAMAILRALFTLATSSRKEAITTQNVGAQARLAVLSIASSNTPLFMTTLGLDILNPLSVEHRKSVMQIVAFLIRKRPLVLHPNLPRLMEAVVKSLDPNSTAHRDAVLDTATEILGHVVKTFPTVDFHMTSQRLAVGTSEGAIVMYDLKTAIRLYVLEGHKKRITACSFSPDGRRLVTLSLEESVVLVWKVGSSFSSFFNPGAPPRQGHGGSEPFKTLSFNVGDEADMTIAGTLEWVRFEWTAERSVKLRIRESILTFST